MTTNQTIASLNLASKEAELRETIAALSPEWLAMVGLGTPEAVEAYVAAELEDAA
jgi:hypothetical protein